MGGGHCECSDSMTVLCDCMTLVVVEDVDRKIRLGWKGSLFGQATSVTHDKITDPFVLSKSKLDTCLILTTSCRGLSPPGRTFLSRLVQGSPTKLTELYQHLEFTSHM